MSDVVIAELERGVLSVRALEIFDSLPVAGIEDINGRWVGSGVPTGHPLDGLLNAYGWYGKRFSSADEVAPLVFSSGGALFEVDPAVIPLRLVLKFPRLAHHPAVIAIGRFSLPLLKTRRPGARLRMVVYRGVSTATMIYDTQPIHDHFRRIENNTLLGAMDLRGLSEPFFFLLRREITTG